MVALVAVVVGEDKLVDLQPLKHISLDVRNSVLGVFDQARQIWQLQSQALRFLL